jgi:hypothetical protein
VCNGIDPIDDDELLYRRVPLSQNWYDFDSQELNAQAFAPNKNRDTTGLSVSRAKYKSLEDAARGQPGKSYLVAIVRAGDLARAGIQVVPRPGDGADFDPAHAELLELNAGNYKSTETLERMRKLSCELCLGVEGPFQTPNVTNQ